jgi:hypothetical protein
MVAVQKQQLRPDKNKILDWSSVLTIIWALSLRLLCTIRLLNRSIIATIAQRINSLQLFDK